MIELCLFAVVIFNALLIVPKVGMKRAMIIKSLAEKSAPPNAEEAYASLKKRVSMMFAVQSILLLGILYLSVFGPGKHPGVF